MPENSKVSAQPNCHARIAEIRAESASALARQRIALPVVAAAVAGSVLVWRSAVVLLPLGGFALREFVRSRSRRLRLSRLAKWYEDSAARRENRFAGLGFAGDEYRKADHAYETDLNLFGTGSLFELMCTARTEIGRRRLAEYLQLPVAIKESRARQEAVRELSGRADLREEIVLLGKFGFRDSAGETFSEWLSHPAEAVHPAIALVALLCSASLAALILFTYVARPLTAQSWMDALPAMAGLYGVSVAIAALYRSKIRGRMLAARRVGLEVGILRDGIALIQGRDFESEKLRALQRELSHDGAARLLGRLERFTNALDHCDKWAFDLPARVLIARTQLWFAIERWRFLHGEALARWMSGWAEFEALAAVAGYAAEHEGDAYPDLEKGTAFFDARGLGHPLIPSETCVRNDVAFGPGRALYVIGGSNMSGKSTLLRAIGLNAVLAYAGAPVRAAELRLTGFRVCASLSIVDSVLEGKSRFLAEIGKLRQMVELTEEETPVLFLIDEILSGTNSKDRRIAAEAIVRNLVAGRALGAISTHDLALTEIAEIPELRGTNVHMGSKDGSDPMDFDYLVKPGVTRESNALAIAQMAGVFTGRATQLPTAAPDLPDGRRLPAAP